MFAIGAWEMLWPTIVKLPPPASRAIFRLICPGGFPSALKLHRVITPGAGAAYCPNGETDWSQVRPLQSADPDGLNVCPIFVAAPAVDALATARSPSAATSAIARRPIVRLPLPTRRRTPAT